MGMYTNSGLVKHAEKALALKTKYMWGGLLRLIEKQYDILYKTYANQSGTGYTPERWNELTKLKNKGIYGVDCVGLIKSYYWSGKADGGTGSPDYGKAGYPDVNANYMFQQAKRKGKISTMPEIPGLIVYSKSHPHVGIYIGNGYTIESTLGSRGDGVVKRRLDSFWEYWFECPYIEYSGKTIAAGATKKYTVSYPANVRDKPSNSSKKIGRYIPGNTVTIIVGSDKKDTDSGYIYVKIAGDKEAWIVKSALK